MSDAMQKPLRKFRIVAAGNRSVEVEAVEWEVRDGILILRSATGRGIRAFAAGGWVELEEIV